MMPGFDFLDKLRQATANHHENLEKSNISVRLLSPGVTRGDYINYLLASYCLHSLVEEYVFPQLAHTLDDIAGRRKAPALQTDLQTLGHNNLPGMLFWGGQTISPAFGIGVMYVIEGSTLGGMHIAKALNQSLGNHAPKAFLTVYGPATGQRWKHFLQTLDNYTKNAGLNVQNEIIEGALFAFNKAEYFFNDSYVTHEL